jgi:hypothetical protein
MTDQEKFQKAWNNYTFIPDDPRDRLKNVVKDRLGVDIMYIQAGRILEFYYTPVDRTYAANWDQIKKQVSELIDDEVLAIYHAFVKRYKGDE